MRRLDRLYLAFFFASGLSGLVYEVLWTRLLTRHLGNTTHSVSTVLVAFMGGLSLGSWLAGRAREGRRWLLVYGLLEFAIGLWCLALPFLVELTPLPLRAVYDALGDHPLVYTLVRFALAAVVLLVPTTLMGATLPVLARHFLSEERTFARRLARLYAVNSAGAVAGALLAGFYLLPTFGEMTANLTAAALNLVIGAAAALAGRGVAPTAGTGRLAAGEAPPAAAGDAPPAPALPLGRPVLVALALSGAASMVYQVVWNRILCSFIGSSTYAFTLLVSAFILGLSLGSAALARWADTRRDPIRSFGLVQGVIAASALGVTLAMTSLSGAMQSLILANADRFAVLEAAEFGALFVLFLVPTFAMGATFPLAARIYATAGLGLGAGRSVGDCYAMNTIGAIVGSFLGGFVLIPVLGLRHAVTFAVGLNLFGGALGLAVAGLRRPRARAALPPLLAAAAGLAVAAGVPGWKRAAVDDAAYIAAARTRDAAAGLAGKAAPPTADARESDELLFYAEGVTATVSVHRHERHFLSLRINGKVDASTATDMPTQLLCGHLPMLLAPDPRRVLVIGLGSGVSLGAITRYAVDAVDCVELCPEVVEATRAHFAEASHDACRDPKVRLLVNDGRNHVALTRARYDVIVSEPTNIWIAGVAGLYTREFFRSCRERLTEDGLLAHWVQVYSLSVDDLRSILAAFAEVFPNCSLWELRPGGDYLLLGAPRPLGLTYARVAERLARPEVASDLARMKLRDPADVLGFVSLGPSQVARLAGDAPPNDDDSARIEFSSPRSLFVPTRFAQMDALLPLRVNPVLALHHLAGNGGDLEQHLDRLTKVFEARRRTIRGYNDWARHEFAKAESDFEEALRINPTDPMALDRIHSLRIATAQYLAGQEGRIDDALALLERAIKLDADTWELWNAQGLLQLQKRDLVPAARSFAEAGRLAPWSPEVWVNRGIVAEPREGWEAAEKCYRRALERNPELTAARHCLGRALAGQRRYAEAVQELERAVAAAPRSPEVHADLGAAYVKLDPPRPDRARAHLEEADRLRRGASGGK
ncbi:MAG: fused MFS/spermidine synthase [Planctomycetes bacterium]|nr:fused MFS/spermidine synthase [Planctomycetota bacterium]